MARSAANQQCLESQVFASLGYLSGKRCVRDQLSVGNTRVQGEISATVGRAVVKIPFSGELRVGADQDSASSSAPDTEHVVALLLEQLDESQRDSLLARLPKQFEESKKLPDVPSSRLSEAQALLKRLRSSVIKPKRGSVVFAVDADEPK